jgi:diacylglycerol kinase family enzyme
VKARVLVNRSSGSVGERSAIESALRRAGIEGRPQWLDGADLAGAADEAVDDGAKLIVAGGGDGTISCVAGALAGSKARLGVLPLGTLNHFARDLGIPMKLDDAAGLIASGRERRVDLGEVNGRLFINNSAIGVYPLMVLDRESQQRRLGRRKRLAMAVAAARTLARFDHQRLTLVVNDEAERVDTPLLFVGNNDYRIDIGAPGRRRSLEDGELSVFVMRKKTRRGFLAASLRALLNRSRPDDLEQIAGVENLRVGSRRSRLPVSLDGEVVRLAPPLSYRIRPKALRVIAP